MKRVVLAFQFLTIIPIRTASHVDRSDLAASMAYFPLVGALQGAILLGAYYIFSIGGFLPDVVRAGLLFALLTLTNGGLHLDGFADTVDGLAGGHTPEERLRIMKDSATGAIGMVFLMLIILLKYVSILYVLGLPGRTGPALLFLFPVAARWAMVPLSAMAPYARKEGGLGEAFTGCSARVLASSTAFTLLVSWAALGFTAFAPLALLFFAAFVLALFFRSRLGGVTGDVFGFQSEISEVIFLLSAPVFMGLLSAYL